MPKGTFLMKTQTIRVRGSKGDEYTVWVLGVSPRACDCPAFQYGNGRDCKHMKARRGRRAVGHTKCVRCEAWLTPEELTYAQQQEIPDGSIPCQECRFV